MGPAVHILIVALTLTPLAGAARSGAGADRAAAVGSGTEQAAAIRSGAEQTATAWNGSEQTSADRAAEVWGGMEKGLRELPPTGVPEKPDDGGKARAPEVRSPAGAIDFAVEPLDEDVGWLRQEVDPIWQARRKIHLAMRERARERALESQPKQGRTISSDPGIDVGDWRFSIGNNGNWSPYPDRELDARIIRFPLRMKTDNRTPAEKAVEQMRQEGRH